MYTHSSNPPSISGIPTVFFLPFKNEEIPSSPFNLFSKGLLLVVVRAEGKHRHSWSTACAARGHSLWLAAFCESSSQEQLDMYRLCSDSAWNNPSLSLALPCIALSQLFASELATEVTFQLHQFPREGTQISASQHGKSVRGRQGGSRAWRSCWRCFAPEAQDWPQLCLCKAGCFTELHFQMPKMDFDTQVGHLRFHFPRMAITKPAVHSHQSEKALFPDMQSHHLSFVSPATCEWMKPFSHQSWSLTKHKCDPEKNTCLVFCCVIELYQLTGKSNKLQSHHRWGDRLFGWEEVWVRGEGKEGTRLPPYGKTKPLDMLRCSWMQLRGQFTRVKPEIHKLCRSWKCCSLMQSLNSLLFYINMILVPHLLFM